MTETASSPLAVETPAVEIRALSKWYGRKPALQGLSLELPRGGVHAVVGRNGAGKSTLLRTLLGFESPSAGHCRVLGVDSRSIPAALRARVGLVNEEHALPGWMTVARLTAMQRALYPSWKQRTFDEVTSLFDVPPGRKIRSLSRGERAGLALALALAQDPELLILDEPTLGLDTVARQAILEALLLTSTGEGSEQRTVVYCSHQMDEIERMADHIVILERGRVAMSASPEELQRRVSAWVVETVPAGFAAASVPGLLQVREIEGSAHLVILDAADDLAEHLRGLGAQGVEAAPIGLDRIIHAFLDRSPRASAEGSPRS